MARHFNGTSDRIISVNALPSATPPAVTIAFWVNGDNAPQGVSVQQVTSIGNGAGSDIGFMWSHSNAAFKQAGYGELVSTAFAQAAVTSVLTLSTWYHMAVVWTGANLLMYFNGALQTTTAMATLGWGASVVMHMSWNGFDPNPNFPGAIADYAAWPVALSALQIATLANGKRADHVLPSNFLVYYPILGQSPEPDKGGYVNNGTVTGTTVVADPPQLEPWAANYIGFPAGMVSA